MRPKETRRQPRALLKSSLSSVPAHRGTCMPTFNAAAQKPVDPSVVKYVFTKARCANCNTLSLGEAVTQPCCASKLCRWCSMFPLAACPGCQPASDSEGDWMSGEMVIFGSSGCAKPGQYWHQSARLFSPPSTVYRARSMLPVVPERTGNVITDSPGPLVHHVDGATGNHPPDPQENHTAAVDLARLEPHSLPSSNSSKTRSAPRSLFSLPQELQDIIFDFAYPRVQAGYIHLTEWKTREAKKWRAAHRNYTKKPFPRLLINDLFVSKAFFIAGAKAWAGNQDFSKGMSFCQEPLGKLQGIVPAFAKTATIKNFEVYSVAPSAVNLRSVTLLVPESHFSCIEDEVIAWEDRLDGKHLRQVAERYLFPLKMLSERVTLKLKANDLSTAGVKTTIAWQCNVANLETYAQKLYLMRQAGGSTRDRKDDPTSCSERHKIYHNSAVAFNTINESPPNTGKTVRPPGDGASSSPCGVLLPTTTERSKEKPVFGKKSAHIDHHQPSSPPPDSLGQAQLLPKNTDGKRKSPKAVAALGKKQERTSDAPVPSVASNSAVLLTQSGYHSRAISLPSPKPSAIQLSPNSDVIAPHGTSLNPGTLRITGVKGNSELAGTPKSNNGHGEAVQKDGSRSIDHDSKGGLANPAQQRTRVLDDGQIPETVGGLTMLFARFRLG
ncbi:hypothetical protein LTR74_017092 [Friedmanniomyces endolithicus]|nr:hypothetical protein LTR74_017092 [Friedmanniomyces endolithicus]